MKIPFFTARRACTFAVTLLLAGCSAAGGSGDGYSGEDGLSETETSASPESVDDTETLEPFAVFESADYGTVQFFEPEEGGLEMAAMTPDGAPGAQRITDASPFDIYEELAREALAERFTRPGADSGESGDAAEELLSDAGAVDVGVALPTPGTLTLTKESMTTDKFINNYCILEEEWCWTNRTNTSYFQKRTDYMRSYVHSYRGQVTHRMRRKNTWGNWKTLYSVTVEPGYTSTYTSIPLFPYTTESKVYNADGDGYHHSGKYEVAN